MADDRQTLIDQLRDANNVGAVDAHNVIDEDNPDWKLLRTLADMRKELTKNFMIMWMNRATGKMGLILRHQASTVQTSETAAPVQVRTPKVFTSLDKAKGWCRIHAKPDEVRHLVIEAIDDTLHEPTYKQGEAISRGEINEFLVSMGFRSFPETGGWNDGVAFIPFLQLDEIRTWGQLTALLDIA